jgi:hypothetical protein
MNCVVSISEPWRGEKHHTTSWIKIISHHKTWRFFLSRSVVGREQGIRNIIYTLLWPLKKSFSAALETTVIDEQNITVIDKWPRFITPEAELSDKQSKPLTKLSAFFIHKGLQGIIGNPKSVIFFYYILDT